MDKFYNYELEDISFGFNCNKVEKVQLREERKEYAIGRPQNYYVCLWFTSDDDFDVEMCFTNLQEAEHTNKYFKNFIERGSIKRVK